MTISQLLSWLSDAGNLWPTYFDKRKEFNPPVQRHDSISGALNKGQYARAQMEEKFVRDSLMNNLSSI